MHPRGGRGVGVERKSWGLASSRVRHPKVVPLPLRHTRWRSSSERNIRKQNVKIRYRSRSTLRRFEEQLTSRGRFFRPTTALPPRRADPARAAADSPCRGLLPDKTPPDRHGGGNQDSRAAFPLPRLTLRRHENPIMQHSDWQRLRIGHALASLRNVASRGAAATA